MGRSILTCLVFLFFTGPALASDGVLEINQACAVNTGCFSGDAAGYPVTIDGSAGKSYRLTSSLKLPDGNTTGIEISGVGGIGLAGATIDLNGFTVGCFPASCPIGTGSAIESDLTLPVPPLLIRVRNGMVQGAGDNGLALGILSVVEDVTAAGNRGVGINVGDHSTVTRSRAFNSGGIGISVGSFSIVERCTSSLNAADGFDGGDGSSFTGNTSSENGDDGIQATSGSAVQANTVRSNGGTGLRLSLDATYRGNTITDQLGSTPIIGGLNMGDNSCNGTMTCP